MEKTRAIIHLCYENKFYLNSLNTNSLSENDKFVIHLSSFESLQSESDEDDPELDDPEDDSDPDSEDSCALFWESF